MTTETNNNKNQGQKRRRRSGISTDLVRQLRTLLLDCGSFETNQNLRTIFVDERLYPWRNRLPESHNPAQRVESIIDFLHNRQNDRGENALVLLLRVLETRVEPGDACRERLAAMAVALEQELNGGNDNKIVHGEQAMRIPTIGNEQRLEDLQRNIERETGLLRDYEKQLTYEDDPRRLLRIRHEIERQKGVIVTYRQEAGQIQALLPATTSPDSAAVQARLEEIDQKLLALSRQLDNAHASLASGQQNIQSDIRQQQMVILSHIDTRLRQTIAFLVDKLDANQLEATELLLDAADRQQIAEWQAKQLTLLGQQALVDLTRLQQNPPDAAQWQSLLDALARETGWEQKLKLTLPIVPGILEFESELAVDVVPALKQAWQRLVNKFRRR